MSQTFTETVKFVVEHCYKCGVAFGLPLDLYNSLKIKGQAQTFYCPNGHGQVYAQSVEQKLRAELATAKSNINFWQESSHRNHQDAQHFKRSRDAYKGVLTKTKERVSEGQCPCCQRRFKWLKKHMRDAHPDYLAQDETTKD